MVMSITTRLWNDADLERLATDDNLLTVFFNVKTYSEKGIKRLYQLLGKRKSISCTSSHQMTMKILVSPSMLQAIPI
jgi:hypothetical protein